MGVPGRKHSIRFVKASLYTSSQAQRFSLSARKLRQLDGLNKFNEPDELEEVDKVNGLVTQMWRRVIGANSSVWIFRNRYVWGCVRPPKPMKVTLGGRSHEISLGILNYELWC